MALNSASFVKPGSPTGSPFSVQMFKQMLDTLKETRSKQLPDSFNEYEPKTVNGDTRG